MNTATIGSEEVRKFGEHGHKNRVYVADKSGNIYSISQSDWVLRASKKFQKHEAMFVGRAPVEVLQ